MCWPSVLFGLVGRENRKGDMGGMGDKFMSMLWLVRDAVGTKQALGLNHVGVG